MVEAVLNDFDSAPLEPPLRAMLVFLRDVTHTPWDIGPEHIRALRDAGLDDRAVEEALFVCFCFNVIDRIADALDFPLSDERRLRWTARILLRLGYGAASLPG